MKDEREDSLHSPSEVDEHGNVEILGELVGAYQLSTQEHEQFLKDKHLRPYCIVKFQDKRIHYSSPCSESGRDPIWTVSTGSLFLVKVSLKTLLYDNLQISVWSRRNSSSLRGKVLLDNDTFFLGKVTLDGKTLLSHCNEERLELPLQDQNGHETLSESTLALRFRLATKRDIRLLKLLRDQGISPPRLNASASFHNSDNRFMETNPVKDLIVNEGSELPIAPVVTETPEAKLAGEFLVDALSFAFKATTTCDKETGLRKVRVKPFPDPSRVDETTFMTPLQISKETMEPSQRWVEAGSGSLGTLHLEILSCHDLPNVDVGEAMGNLSDCFVCAVFEDVMVQTPVIDDELSPHWLPWTQRAFRIGIVHPSSTLYLGVLDYDLGPGTHEPIGRVAINLNNLQSNMLYTLKYDLHPTSDLTDRTPNGSIKIRLRIEYKDEKGVVLAALQPRPCFHVNARMHKTFKAVRYVCYGEYDVEEQFSWAVTRSYIGEILEYWRGLKFYFGEASKSLIFWRGQVEICSMNLPVHSAMLFISCAILIERPWLIVPFYCLFAAWFMLAMMSHRRKTPSPWNTCNSFLHYSQLLITGKSFERRERIRPSEMLSKTEAHEKEVREWKERYQNYLDEQWAREEKLNTIGNENIQTEVAGQIVPLDLLERLGRYQGIVGRICTKIRKIKSIITWEESATSFWITAICLAVGLVTLILPWKFLLYHISRIIVWGFLAPHMRLVDIYLQSISKDTDAHEEFRKQSRLARIRREEAIKLRDMKCLAFGEYVTLIPAYNLPRHYDRPRHESFARYIPPGTAQENKLPAISRIPGQQLYGSMIPHTKSGLLSNTDEAKHCNAKLAEIKEQVIRLQSIEERLSSTRHLDHDLPDDLGYEITLCDEDNTIVQASKQGLANRMPKDYEISLSLSQIGFNTRIEEWEALSLSPKSKDERLRVVRGVTARRISEVDENSWDIDEERSQHSSIESKALLAQSKLQNSESGASNDSLDTQQSFADEVAEGDKERPYMTPPQTHFQREEDHSEPSFMTPLLPELGDKREGDKDDDDGHHNLAYLTPMQRQNEGKTCGEKKIFFTPEQETQEEKKEESTPASAMGFLELKFRELSSSINAQIPVREESLRKRTIEGPNRRTILGDSIVHEGRNSESTPSDHESGLEGKALINRKTDDKEVSNDNISGATANAATTTMTEQSIEPSRPCATANQKELLKKTRSNSFDLERKSIWIKPSPTDSLLLPTSNNPAERRKSSVKWEEGLEIVAMGRLRTVGDEDAEDNDHEDENDEDDDCSEDSTTSSSRRSSRRRGLSTPYESSKHVQVAMYRP